MKGAVDLSEMNKLITDQIKVVNTTLESLNNKDTLTAEDIKEINNKLTTSLKGIETKMADFNKMFIDTEELQSEINKFKNEIINSNKNKDLAVTNLMKTDIENIKSSNEELKKKVNEINDIIVKINNKNIETSIRISDIDLKINTNKTERILKDEELKREIDDVVKTVALEFTKIQTKVSDMETLTARLDNKNEESSIRISDIDLKINTKIITDIDELKKEIETITEYNRGLDKRIINSNAQSQIKLTEIRKDLGIFVTTLEDKITQTKKDLSDDTHNIKELLFHKNGTFKLVKSLELDERIKETKEQLQNEIVKKPLQFPIKIATFIADEVSCKKKYKTNLIFLILIQYLNIKRSLLRIIF